MKTFQSQIAELKMQVSYRRLPEKIWREIELALVSFSVSLMPRKDVVKLAKSHEIADEVSYLIASIDHCLRASKIQRAIGMVKRGIDLQEAARRVNVVSSDVEYVHSILAYARLVDSVEPIGKATVFDKENLVATMKRFAKRYAHRYMRHIANNDAGITSDEIAGDILLEGLRVMNWYAYRGHPEEDIRVFALNRVKQQAVRIAEWRGASLRSPVERVGGGTLEVKSGRYSVPNGVVVIIRNETVEVRGPKGRTILEGVDVREWPSKKDNIVLAGSREDLMQVRDACARASTGSADMDPIKFRRVVLGEGVSSEQEESVPLLDSSDHPNAQGVTHSQVVNAEVMTEYAASIENLRGVFAKHKHHVSAMHRILNIVLNDGDDPEFEKWLAKRGKTWEQILARGYTPRYLFEFVGLKTRDKAKVRSLLAAHLSSPESPEMAFDSKDFLSVNLKIKKVR